MRSALGSRGRARCAAALLAAVAAGCVIGPESVPPYDPWIATSAQPEPVERAGGGSALVVHSAGLDALLSDPRDAGLRRALALLDERLRELPAEADGFWLPPGSIELLSELASSPWTLRLDVAEGNGDDGGEGGAGPLSAVRAQWTFHTGSPARAAEMEARFGALLSLLTRPTSAVEDRSELAALELTAVELPLGTFSYGARASDGAFLVALGEPSEGELELAALGLPPAAEPVFALELDLSALMEAFEPFLEQADPSGALRRQLAWTGLRGDAPIGFTLAIGRASDRAHVVSRYRNWRGAMLDAGALASEPLPREALRLVPADATLVSLQCSEPLGVLRAFDALGVEHRAEVLEDVQRLLGLDLAADVLAPLGQSFGFYLSDTTGGGGLASAVFFAALDEPERFGQTIDALARRLNDQSGAALAGRVRACAFEHDGAHCLALQFPGLPVPFEPTLAIQREHLFAAATPQALFAALEHARTRAPDLRDHPRLAPLEAGSLDDLQALFFCDVPRLARDGYGLAGVLASALANGVRSSLDPLREPGLVLPPYPELLADARATLLLSRIQGDDLVTVGEADRSAMLHVAAMLGLAPGVLAALAFTGTLAAVAVPPAAESVALEPEAKVEADIWALMDALHSYAIENMGRYPESLAELVVPDENGFTFLNNSVIPVDPWGNAYRYELTDNEPHVFTYGADGVAGGEGLDRDVDNLALESGPDEEPQEASEPEEGG